MLMLRVNIFPQLHIDDRRMEPEEHRQRQGHPLNDHPGQEPEELGFDQTRPDLLYLEGQSAPLGQIQEEEEDGDLPAGFLLHVERRPPHPQGQDEQNLHADLQPLDESVDDVQRVGKAFHVVVEEAGDDSEVDVEKGEKGRESKQINVDIFLVFFRPIPLQMADLGQADDQRNHSHGIDHDVGHFVVVFGLVQVHFLVGLMAVQAEEQGQVHQGQGEDYRAQGEAFEGVGPIALAEKFHRLGPANPAELVQVSLQIFCLTLYCLNMSKHSLPCTIGW